MNRLQANLVLLVVAMIWGSTFVVQQVGTGGLGALMFTASRFCLGGFFVLPFALKQLKKINGGHRPIQRNDWFGMMFTGCMLFLGASLQQFGIFFTTVSNAGFLTALYVPLVPFLGFFILKKRVHWSVWPSALACLVGTYIMSGAGVIELKVGDLWVIGSAFFWAAHVLCVGVLAIRTGAPLVIAVVQFFSCSVLAAVIGVFVEQPQLVDFNGAFQGICYAGILSVGLGFTSQVVGQRYTNPADAAIILSTETVFAALAGFLFLGERLTGLQLLGAALIFAGVLAVELLPMAKRKTVNN